MSPRDNLSVGKALEGFVKIWQVNPADGASTLLVDKKNLILKGGAKLIAHTLGGDQLAKIWGMYIGYNNTPSFTPPAIDVDYTNKLSNYTGPFGYLREPLTFSPSYMSSPGYEDNTVLFQTMVTSATAAGGAAFGIDSRIFEVALVSVPDVNNANLDTVFSRTNFNPIQYNSSYNLTITWGVRVTL